MASGHQWKKQHDLEMVEGVREGGRREKEWCGVGWLGPGGKWDQWQWCVSHPIACLSVAVVSPDPLTQVHVELSQQYSLCRSE